MVCWLWTWKGCMDKKKNNYVMKKCFLPPSLYRSIIGTVAPTAKLLLKPLQGLWLFLLLEKSAHRVIAFVCTSSNVIISSSKWIVSSLSWQRMLIFVPFLFLSRWNSFWIPVLPQLHLSHFHHSHCCYFLAFHHFSMVTVTSLIFIRPHKDEG